MKWYEVKISSCKDISEDINAFFSKYGIEEMVIEDPSELDLSQNSDVYWDYVDEESVSYNHDEIVYKIYAELGEEGLSSIKNDLDDFLRNFQEIAKLDSINIIDPNAGLDEWKKYFKPFEIYKDIVVCPSWENYQKDSGKIVIDMDPSGAFGTGTHETTSMCACLIADFMKNNKDKNINLLDVGTGSGILSILALKLGVSKAVGVEIDENALEIAVENAKKNSVSDRFVAQKADLNYGENYDLIVANLIAPVIIDLNKRLKKALALGGYIILSGIIDKSLQDVKNVFDSESFEMYNEFSDGDWHALMYKRIK